MRYPTPYATVIFCTFSLLTGFCFGPTVQAHTPPVIHHHLEASLIPEQHTLQADDLITLPESLTQSSILSFHLNPHLTITALALNGQPLPLTSMTIEPRSQTPHSVDPSRSQRIQVVLPPQDHATGVRIVRITYEGQINDPPQKSGGLRFVKPDETNGHIGPEGIFLTSETFWLPTWEGILSTYELALTLPDGWEAVTQDKPFTRLPGTGTQTTTWKIHTPSEALTLAANRFIVHTRQWHDIELATYLFADEASLAPQYLDAAIRYLELYTELLGPFPFSTFAVAENFFPSGLGMPAFTLLGQGVMRRGYTQPYSLGHEIVHSWFGNSVLNDFSQGNWVEGLTTYLANYYFDEATGNMEEAFNTRRRMHHEYNVYTTPQDDYPVRQFHHKETRRDNAVGYQKTALVFHMLRQEVGDQIFFQGIRQIVKEGTGRYMEWPDLERIFSGLSGQNLGWFFTQWVDQAGAPSLAWNNVEVQEHPQQAGEFVITGTMTQLNPPYRFTLPLEIELGEGRKHSTTLAMSRTLESLAIQVPARPTKILVDPQLHVLRRLKRDQLPPMLNVWETDTAHTVLLPLTQSPQEEAPYASLIQRLTQQPDIRMLRTMRPDYSQAGSYLTVGNLAQQTLEDPSRNPCSDLVEVSDQHVTILGQSYTSPDMAFLISCPYPGRPGHIQTFFFGLSPEAMTPVSRLLFFYGWDSYLVFQQGRVIARGRFNPVHSAHGIPLGNP